MTTTTQVNNPPAQTVPVTESGPLLPLLSREEVDGIAPQWIWDLYVVQPATRPGGPRGLLRRFRSR